MNEITRYSEYSFPIVGEELNLAMTSYPNGILSKMYLMQPRLDVELIENIGYKLSPHLSTILINPINIPTKWSIRKFIGIYGINGFENTIL